MYHVVKDARQQLRSHQLFPCLVMKMAHAMPHMLAAERRRRKRHHMLLLVLKPVEEVAGERENRDIEKG